MHLIITDAWMARQRAVHLSGTQLFFAFLAAALVLMLTALGLYHWVFLKAAREGWPVVSTLVKLVIQEEVDQRERFVKENVQAMAKRLGEIQAKLLQLDALGERVSSLAGVNPADVKAKPGAGGVLIGDRPLTTEELNKTLADLEKLSDQKVDLLTVVESRLFDQKIKKMLIPTQKPVMEGTLGSPFGWRIDPFTGSNALHTGMDFTAETGTPILAAAGGMVVTMEKHAAYGNLVEIDHGNQLITRYAHASLVFVKKGDLVKRGQKIAAVGSTGRSTGPHLHFEVLVNGVPQNPQKFLNAGQNLAHAGRPATAKPQ